MSTIIDSNGFLKDDVLFPLKSGNRLFEENGDYRKAVNKKDRCSTVHNISISQRDWTT